MPRPATTATRILGQALTAERQLHAKIEQLADADLRFVGNVEAHDMIAHRADVVEEQRWILIGQGRWETLRDWMSRLPATVIRARPGTSLAAAVGPLRVSKAAGTSASSAAAPAGTSHFVRRDCSAAPATRTAAPLPASTATAGLKRSPTWIRSAAEP